MIWEWEEQTREKKRREKRWACRNKVKSEKLIIQRWKWNYFLLSFLMLLRPYRLFFPHQFYHHVVLLFVLRTYFSRLLLTTSNSSSVRCGGKFCGFYHVHIIIMFHIHKLLITHIYEAFKYIHKLMINYIQNFFFLFLLARALVKLTMFAIDM